MNATLTGSLWTLPRNRQSESGQAAVMVVLAMGVFLIGALGLAIDGSQLYSHRQMAQAAADAAAQAAALSMYHGTNTTSSSPFTAGTSFTCTTTSGTTPCVYARLNGFGATTGDTVAITFPSSVPGVMLAPFPTHPLLQVTVRRNVSTPLFGFIGAPSFDVATSATAALAPLATTNCITALNPSASGAFSINGSVTLQLTNCGIAVDSSSSSALAISGGAASVSAGSISVVGGVSDPHHDINAATPVTQGLPSFGDPFALVPAPSYNASHCDYTSISYTGGSKTLSPGVYCGGMGFGGNANITFSPGTYILLGGGLSATGTPTLNGNGVTFYNTYNSSHPVGGISIGGNVTGTLTAPSTGSLQGMLFFEDRSVTAGSVSDSLSGNASLSLTGTLYFPQDALTFQGNSKVSSSTENVAIVADTASFSGNPNINYNANATGASTEIKVALVQ